MNHTNDTDDHRAQYIEQVKRIGADRVFLCTDRFFTDSKERRKARALLRENVAYYKSQGIREVGTWFTAMGHGGQLDHESEQQFGEYPRHVGFDGTTCDDTFCIGDPGYRKLIAENVREMGECGVDIIMLDDDLRLAVRGNGIGCTCDYHMKKFAEITGCEWTREALFQAVYCGEPNDTRRAWFALMQENFYGFAKALRDALDTVAPQTRLGYCACYTSFDCDCIDAAELAKIFAGKTQPYLRGIGAAYWESDTGRAVCDVISYERMERNWMKKMPELEFFTEGDLYPRPRYRVPGWLVETFDTALRADGSTDGILKYMFDYVQTPNYETGYLERHEKHASLYQEIEEAFDGGITRGVFLYEKEHRLLDAVLKQTTPKDTGHIQESAFSNAARFLNRVCAPMSVIENGDAVIVMGESGRHMPLDYLKYGTILDIASAVLLTERGVDCGIVSVVDAPVPDNERYPAIGAYEPEDVRPLSCGSYKKAMLANGAEVLSTFTAGKESYPAAWYYENAQGQKFLVYAFEMQTIDRNSQLVISYARQAQFNEVLPRLQGKAPAAVCSRHPYLYMIVKDLSDGSRAVGLWNTYADEMLTPIVTLDSAYKTVRFLGGAQGSINGNEVVFSTDIPAHTFAGFVVSK